MNVWKSYIWTEYESDPRSNNTTWAVVKIRPEKNSGLYEILTHDLCDTGAVLYQLSQQANRLYPQFKYMTFKTSQLFLNSCYDKVRIKQRAELKPHQSQQPSFRRCHPSNLYIPVNSAVVHS